MRITVNRLYILTILIVLSFYSCSSSIQKDSNMLEGDWMQEVSSINSSQDEVGLKFRDDTLWTIKSSGLWQKGKCTIKDDTIFVEEYNKKISKIFIQKHTVDSLNLFINSKLVNYYRRRLDYDSSLSFKKIILKTGGCYGNCSKLKIILDSCRYVDFMKYSNNKVINRQKFRLSYSEFAFVDSLFKQSCINKIDTCDYYGAHDDWEITIEFDYNNKSKTIRGTYNFMPYRIIGIVKYLVNSKTTKK
jgi:hypothetical protein